MCVRGIDVASFYDIFLDFGAVPIVLFSIIFRRHGSFFFFILSRFIVTVCVFVCHLFSLYPFYFDFHSERIIFDVSSGFHLWNVNRTTTWHLLTMLKFAFKDVSTKNSEPTYWTILFVMPKMYFIYKIAGKKSRRAI